jgi:hypothetical protein
MKGLLLVALATQLLLFITLGVSIAAPNEKDLATSVSALLAVLFDLGWFLDCAQRCVPACSTGPEHPGVVADVTARCGSPAPSRWRGSDCLGVSYTQSPHLARSRRAAYSQRPIPMVT